MNYLSTRKSVDKLLKDAGGQFFIRRKQDETHDPVEGTVTTVNKYSEKFNAVVLIPDSKTTDYFKSEVGVSNKRSIRKVILSLEGVNWTPQDLDKFLYQDKWWTIRMPSVLNIDGNTDIFMKAVIVKG